MRKFAAIIASVLTWLVIAEASKAESPAQKHIDQVDLEIAGIQKLLPIRTSATQQLTAVYRQGSNIHYRYREEVGLLKFDAAAVRKAWETDFATSICSDQSIRSLLNAGFSVIADVVQEKGVLLAAAYVDIQTCNALSRS